MPHQQMADHRLCTGQSIHTAAGAVRGQLIAGGILREASHHGNGGGPGLLQTFATAQQSIRAAQPPPAHTAAALLQGHLQGLISGEHRTDLQAEGGSAALRHLDLTLGEFGLDPCIQQQTDALPPYRSQRPLPDRETIEAIALHVVDAGITPVERSPVHHIGMGDQTSTGRRQQSSTGKGITGKPTRGAADPCGNHHQQRQRLGTHC